MTHSFLIHSMDEEALMLQLRQELIGSDATLVVRTADGAVRRYKERGVKTLLCLLQNEPEALRGAYIADRVVGRAAAALMLAGGVRRLYALTLSQHALSLLDGGEMAYQYDVLAPHILNRTQTGLCPMEQATMDAPTVSEAVERIRATWAKLNAKPEPCGENQNI